MLGFLKTNFGVGKAMLSRLYAGYSSNACSPLIRGIRCVAPQTRSGIKNHKNFVLITPASAKLLPNEDGNNRT